MSAADKPDHAQILRAAYAEAERSWPHRQNELLAAVYKHLPAVLAELDRLRAAMGEDIETRAGFSGRATEALK